MLAQKNSNSSCLKIKSPAHVQNPSKYKVKYVICLFIQQILFDLIQVESIQTSSLILLLLGGGVAGISWGSGMSRWGTHHKMRRWGECGKLRESGCRYVIGCTTGYVATEKKASACGVRCECMSGTVKPVLWTKMVSVWRSKLYCVGTLPYTWVNKCICLSVMLARP